MSRSLLIALAATAVTTALTPLPAAVGPVDAPTGVHYVALGDSYSSGVGAGDYISASGSCYRSANAYSARWAAAHAPASYTSVACSGATTRTVVDSQLSALDTATTLVTITVGGNDVGFASTMYACVSGNADRCRAAAQAAGTATRTRLPGLLDTAYAAIAARAPQAEVIVLGYPLLYQSGPCENGDGAPDDATRAELNTVGDLLDEVTAAAAGRHGFTFSDVRPAFTDHRLCGPDPWLYGLNAADGRGSFHPTAAGQNGYYGVLEGS